MLTSLNIPVVLALICFLACTSVLNAQPSESRDTLEFAGLTWRIKHSNELMGPGPNHFSNDPRDVWTDDDGNLHLALNHRDGKWLSTELVSDWPVGYGTYEFRLAGSGSEASGAGPDQLDPNVVLGLFTWDTDSWPTDANSEIDIELTRWCEAGAPNLHYSVHPAWGPDGKHPERYKPQRIDLKGSPSTHVITWSPKGVECAMYLGDAGPDPDKLICQWRFGADNPPRVAGDAEGNITEPIVIPNRTPPPPSASTSGSLTATTTNSATRQPTANPSRSSSPASPTPGRAN